MKNNGFVLGTIGSSRMIRSIPLSEFCPEKVSSYNMIRKNGKYIHIEDYYNKESFEKVLEKQSVKIKDLCLPETELLQFLMLLENQNSNLEKSCWIYRISEYEFHISITLKNLRMKQS